jgi:putative hydrolase of the HAD superfamily
MAESSSITTLFLDIGGVLLTNGWDRDARADAVKKFGLDYDEVNERHHLLFDTYEEGKLSLDQYLSRVIFYEDRSFSKDDFRDFMFAQSKPYEESIAYFSRLKEKYKLRITAVSNEGRELNNYRIKTFKLNELIDAFISSSYVHFRKPDDDMFRIALDVSQVEGNEVVYIDDRKLYIQVAGEMGINGIHHKSLEKTRIELEKFGLQG